ncbi:MAG: M20 family metallo-hydrolase [Deltaproteobacteria bacterium]|nr:M20 family metallo-hydrolase [Deltaproteobacteria bacterium]MBW2308400.1 M20 family metallo-hydrolase [Deltaproteobacteria bacterium]
MIEPEITERVEKRIRSLVPDMIEMQKVLCAARAVGPENGGEGEHLKAEKLRAMVEPLQPAECLSLDAPDSRVPSGVRPNRLYRFSGRGRGRTTVWILSHLDVVPPGDLNLWRGDPFQASVEEGWIYGRGVEDNQQAMVASIAAVRALREEGIVPTSDVGLAFVSDEETGSRLGLGYVLEMRPDLFSTDDLILVPDASGLEGAMIEVTEKSVLWLRFHVRGQQCHASRPDQGRNAARAAAHMIVALDGLGERFGRKDPLFGEIPASTFEPTKREANVPNINTIPGEDVFYLDARVLPDYPLEEVIDAAKALLQPIAGRFGVSLEIAAAQSVQAPPPTPVDSPIVHALKQAIARVYGLEGEPMGIGGGTVAALFRQRGLAAAVWSRTAETAHAPNERCSIEFMTGDACVMAHLMLQEHF